MQIDVQISDVQMCRWIYWSADFRHKWL